MRIDHFITNFHIHESFLPIFHCSHSYFHNISPASSSIPKLTDSYNCIMLYYSFFPFDFSVRIAMILWITIKKQRSAAMVTFVHQVFKF